jgi:hypothetical protein
VADRSARCGVDDHVVLGHSYSSSRELFSIIVLYSSQLLGRPIDLKIMNTLAFGEVLQTLGSMDSSVGPGCEAYWFVGRCFSTFLL